MKKILAGIMIFSMAILSLTACGRTNNVASPPTDVAKTGEKMMDTAEKTGEKMARTVGEAGENMMRTMGEAGEKMGQTVGETGENMARNTGKTGADTSKFIGEEKAKELALKKAGIGAEGVKFDRVELDRDNGMWQYEVDFKYGNVEYDVDVNAENGEIVSFETEKEENF